MTFIKAIQHATIGYGIRRKAWTERENCYLELRYNELWWAAGNVVDREAKLCPDIEDADLAIDIIPEDIVAIDWEIV